MVFDRKKNYTETLIEFVIILSLCFQTNKIGKKKTPPHTLSVCNKWC